MDLLKKQTNTTKYLNHTQYTMIAASEIIDS